MVSVVCSEVWTEVWNPIPHLTPRKAPPHKEIGAALGPYGAAGAASGGEGWDSPEGAEQGGML
jgi:hypothetical protein